MGLNCTFPLYNDYLRLPWIVFGKTFFFSKQTFCHLVFFGFVRVLRRSAQPGVGVTNSKEVLMEMMAIFPTNHLLATIELERFGNFQICAKSVDTLSALFVVLQS